MNKEFVLYEEALALKELGFDEPCFAVFYDTKEFKTYTGTWVKFNSEFGGKGVISSPIYQQAFDWFRTEHKMKFHIHEDQWNHWCTPEILIPETGDYEEICDSYETFREAELACLKKLIQIVNQNKEDE